ncbi:hypothetical protein [Nannocystis pusilla]|uniref:hypothetical protein n=1 Tax=Nannocystis pusilla TaxID=889268 RepID=UPI003B77B575
MPACTEYAADRRLEAAELAAPIAAAASVAPEDRRLAAAMAAGVWIDEGRPDTRCRAKALLDAYFADPTLPRNAALERRRRAVEADKCEKSGSPAEAPPPAAATAPPASAPEPEAAPPTKPRARDRLPLTSTRSNSTPAAGCSAPASASWRS